MSGYGVIIGLDSQASHFLFSVCSYGAYYYLILMRILMGLAGGLTFPAMNVLIAEWAPKQERSTMSSLIYGGNKALKK